MIKRVLVEVHMTKEGFKFDFKELDFKTQELKQRVSETFHPEVMDLLTQNWQAFRNGTNKKNYELFRNYIDLPLDMEELYHLDYQKYMRMDEE